MKIQYFISKNNANLVLKLIGELDSNSAKYARETMDELITKYEPKVAVFELPELTFIDSAGIGVLIGRYKTLSKCNCSVSINEPAPAIDKMFKFAGLYSIMEGTKLPLELTFIDVSEEEQVKKEPTQIEDSIIKNRLYVTVPAIRGNEALLNQSLLSFVAPFNPTAEELADLRTIASEATTNAVIHAFDAPAEKNEVSLEAELFESEKERMLKFSVSDNGKGIENVALAMEPFFTTKPEEERSGMGFEVMKAFSDTLNVESTPGKGTKVIMTKNFGKEEQK